MSRRRVEGERGAVLPICALVLGALILFTSFAVDLGYQRTARRDMQALADVIALDLARRLNGSTAGALASTMDVALVESLARNVEDTVGEPPAVTYRLGVVNGANQFTAVASNQVPTAVEVRAETEVDYFFRPGTGGAVRLAVAGQDSCGEFLLGSLLGSIDTGQAALLNRVLPRWLGSLVDLNLDVASWQGVANSTIDVARLRAEMEALSPGSAASGTISRRNFLLAAANSFTQPGNATQAALFNSMAAAVVNPSANFDVNSWLGGNIGNGSAAGGVANVPQFLPLLPFVSGAAQAINGTSTIDLTGVNVGIPGLTVTSASLRVTQAPVLGDCRNPARNAQVVLSLTTALDIDAADITLINQTLAALGIAPFPLPTPLTRLTQTASAFALTGTLRIDVTSAGATGTIPAGGITCPGTPGAGMAVFVDTQLVTATVHPTTLSLSATLATPAVPPLVPPITLLNQLLATVTLGNASAPIQATGGDGTVTFLHPSEFAPNVGTGGAKRPAANGNLGLTAPTTAATSNTTLVAPIATANQTLTIGNVNALLAPVVSELNRLVVSRLSRALGLSLGSADVTALSLRCDALQLFA